MKTQNLYTFVKDTEARAVETGVSAIPEDSLRNRGAGRTLAKRKMLASVSKRAKAAGLEPLRAYY